MLVFVVTKELLCIDVTISEKSFHCHSEKTTIINTLCCGYNNRHGVNKIKHWSAKHGSWAGSHMGLFCK